MILAVWHRWRQQHQWWWLIVLGGILLVDVAISGWILSWELTHMREWMP